MSLLPYLSDAVTIFVAVLASEFVLDAYRRHRKRARMRQLNRLSQRARAEKKRASDGGSQGSSATAS